MEFEPVIGIEIHVELKTRSKMFSSAPCSFGQSPNSMTTYYDLAFPGTMPVVNKEAVAYGIKVVTALHMTLDHTLYFDRKNYFYPDLPKGYQITQQFHPIGRDGFVSIYVDGVEKRIGVEQAHLEEDTAKQVHLSDISLIDFNRCGTPLIEIVSRPDMHSGLEAMKYVEAIREIVTYLDVSDGKMENGSLRCDVNISLRERGSERLGSKCECKNLNTIQNIRSAVDYEIDRQKRILEAGGTIEQETRRFDESQKKTVLLRKKVDSIDYRYFREPNIVPIDLDDGFIYDAIHTMNKLPSEYRRQFKRAGLEENEIELLLSDKELASYYSRCLTIGVKSPKTLWNLLTTDVLAHLRSRDESLADLPFRKRDLVYLSDRSSEGKINSRQCKDVLAEMFESGKKPADIIQERNYQQVSDDSFVNEIVEQVIASNAQSIADWKRGKDRALGYLVGQAMKLSKGKINPSKAKELILTRIGPCGKEK